MLQILLLIFIIMLLLFIAHKMNNNEGCTLMPMNDKTKTEAESIVNFITDFTSNNKAVVTPEKVIATLNTYTEPVLSEVYKVYYDVMNSSLIDDLKAKLTAEEFAKLPLFFKK